MLRPEACRWFELVALRADLVPLMATLARGGAVELELHDAPVAPLVIGGVERARERLRALARSDAAHWPPPQADPGAAPVTDPAQRLQACVDRLEAWHRDAEPLLAAREGLLAATQGHEDLAQWLAVEPELLPEPGLLAARGDGVADAALYRLRAPQAATELPAGLLQLPADGFVLLVGRRDELAAADERLRGRQARHVPFPPGLPGGVAAARAQLAAQLAADHEQRRALDEQLQALAATHGLASALHDAALVEWLLQHGAELAASERMVWVTGWTSAADAAALADPLREAGLRCVVRIGHAPAGSEAPALLRNPRALRAFETFARLLGQPGRDEADPTPVLALVAPVLFGFMFGDVGQGAVLCVAGLLLRRRLPALAMLVPGGLSAMAFGLLFGSVFAREDLIPALWLHPLADPVALLQVALALGAAILLAGLALNAVQAAWRHALPRWWAHDAALLFTYVGMLISPWQPSALWLSALGAVWAAVGGALTAERSRAAGLAASLAHFVEQLLQLAVNTVSFARVGAFALAHAGLSAAVVGVAEAAGGVGYGLVLVLGNLLILLLEGLVVGIQTTRLLLFEFFVRFLQGSGRAFRPLALPVTPRPPAAPLESRP